MADYSTDPTRTTAPTSLYQAPIIRLQIVRESTVTAPCTIRTPADVYAALQARFAAADREVMVALSLNVKNHILAIDPVFVDCLARVTLTMREAFKSAMLLGAAAVIFAHNHPSNDCTPSPEDIQVTRDLCQAGQVLGIVVLDHVVLGDTAFTSLRTYLPSLWMSM